MPLVELLDKQAQQRSFNRGFIIGGLISFIITLAIVCVYSYYLI